MNLRRVPPGWTAALLLAGARTAVCVYRAAHQSLTIDEAFTYNRFVSGPWSSITGPYDANNHVLYSILAKLSVHAFGLSEFTLRLPSVLAGLALVLGIYAVLERLTDSRAIRWVALLALCLNPLLLDFSVAARGYGMSVAFLAWALYFFMRERAIVAGVLLGLGMAANLMIAFPAAALVACAFILRPGGLGWRLGESAAVGIPAAAVFAIFCFVPLQTATAANFYAGLPSFWDSLYDFVQSSIRDTPDRAGLFGTGSAAREIRLFLLPALAAFIAGVSGYAYVRGERKPWLAPAAALLFSVLASIAAHIFKGINYPTDRMGLYLILLLGLAWAAAASQTQALAARVINAVLACALIAQFATQFQTRYFSEWIWDMPAKQVAQIIARDARGKPPASMAVSSTWIQQPALEFYRQYYGISALKPVERYMQTPLTGFDYYVLNLSQDDAARKGNLSRLARLYEEPLSGVLLAREPASSGPASAPARAAAR